MYYSLIFTFLYFNLFICVFIYSFINICSYILICGVVYELFPIAASRVVCGLFPLLFPLLFPGVLYKPTCSIFCENLHILGASFLPLTAVKLSVLINNISRVSALFESNESFILPKTYCRFIFICCLKFSCPNSIVCFLLLQVRNTKF